MPRHRSRRLTPGQRLLIAAAAALLGAGLAVPAVATAATLDNPGHHHGHHHGEGGGQHGDARGHPGDAPHEQARPNAPAAPVPAPPAPAAPPAAVAPPVVAQPALVLPPSRTTPSSTRLSTTTDEPSALPAVVGTGVSAVAVGGFAWLLASGRSRKAG